MEIEEAIKVLQDIIKELTEIRPARGSGKSFNLYRIVALDIAIKALKGALDPWTPITKKEPPKNMPVWVTIKQREGWKPAVVPGVLHEDGWEIVPGQVKEYTVTAWSPFLEPYQGGDNV